MAHQRAYDFIYGTISPIFCQFIFRIGIQSLVVGFNFQNPKTSFLTSNMLYFSYQITLHKHTNCSQFGLIPDFTPFLLILCNLCA